jgi:hypothetical protein
VEVSPAADVIRALATLGEIVVFTLLGLTISLPHVATAAVLVPGVVLAVLMMVVVRPLLVGLVLLPVRLTGAERLFVLWSGLKGAVPIVLGVFLLLQGVPQAQRLYAVIFVVVLISVFVQGGTVPLAAHALHIPMQRHGADHPAGRRGAGHGRGPSQPATGSGTGTGTGPQAGGVPQPRPRVAPQGRPASPVWAPPWLTRAMSRVRQCLRRLLSR